MTAEPGPSLPSRLGLALAALAWLFVACVAIQFFLVGLLVFHAEPWTGLHREFAYTYGWLTPILVLLAMSSAGSPRARRLALALLVLFAIQTFLPLLKGAAPWIAAIHAPNALLVAWLAVQLARAVSPHPGAVGTPGR